jgi:hypothetical protein
VQQVRQGRLLALAAAVTLAAAATSSCSSDDDDSRSLDKPSSTSSPQAPGEARTTPSSVRVGDRFVITPDAVIQPICLNAAVVLQASTSGQKRVGILMPDGAWQGYDTGPDPTVAACRPAASTDAQSYEVPSEMAGGVYVVCLTWEQDEAGCGALTVED